MTVKYVRLKDANPAVNPGWMTQHQWEKELSKDKNLNRLVKITIQED